MYSQNNRPPRRGGTRPFSSSRPGSQRPTSQRPSSQRPTSQRPGGYRPAQRSFGKSRGRFHSGARIDVSKFINKAVITEEVEQFIPEHTFATFEYDERLKQTVAEKGYVSPTPIQDRAIPHILRGSDIVGIANTGTGKTAAFLLPLIHKMLTNRRERILIVAPTRELAIQIDEEFQGFTKGMRLFSVVCVGGAPIGRQIGLLKREHNVIIGTPGRLKDLIESRHINLGYFKTIVLDEADRMLDMGFIDDVRFLMNLMQKDRHTLFFSATLSPEISRLISEFLNAPVTISVKNRDTSKNVDQDVVRIKRDSNKIDVLHELLTQNEFSKVLVFGKTKHGVEKLSQMLVARGFKAESIHGDKNHSRRQNALRSFKNNNVQILVATDVAARGLDIDSVSHVINYDLPSTYEDYVHRIGRTGRGGKKGKALTFIEE